MLVLPLAIATGCKSAQVVTKIDADIFLHDSPPAELCAEGAPLWNHGIYRKVSCSKNPQSQFCQKGEKDYEEFISYCHTAIKSYLSMHAEDKKKWMDKLIRECK